LTTMGYGYGSECHLLRWMGRHRTAFDSAIRQAIGMTGGSVDWLDFKFNTEKEWPDSELQGLEYIDEPAIREIWKGWWPQGRGIHNWDAVGLLGGNDSKEIILVEAKAHITEMGSRCKASDSTNRQRIEQSLTETAEYIGVKYNPGWMNSYYQFANRIAVVYFLKKHGYTPHLIMIYFVGDLGNASRVCPQTPDGWEQAIFGENGTLAIPPQHALSNNIHRLFLHVSQNAAWLQPNMSSQINIP